MSLPVLPLFIPGRLLKIKNLNAQLKTRSTATANTRASYSLLIKKYTDNAAEYLASRHEFTLNTKSEIYKWYKTKRIKCKLVEER